MAERVTEGYRLPGLDSARRPSSVNNAASRVEALEGRATRENMLTAQAELNAEVGRVNGNNGGMVTTNQYGGVNPPVGEKLRGHTHPFTGDSRSYGPSYGDAFENYTRGPKGEYIHTLDPNGNPMTIGFGTRLAGERKIVVDVYWKAKGGTPMSLKGIPIDDLSGSTVTDYIFDTLK